MSDAQQQIFGDQLAHELHAACQNANETRRYFIVGTITHITAASVCMQRMLWSDRVATLIGFVGGPAAESLATCGLFADTGADAAAGRFRCFHCGVVMDASSSDSPPWPAHSAASPGCQLASLGRHLLAPDSADVQAGGRRYQTVLRRLRQLLDSPVVGAAAVYGFEPAFLRLCAGRHFMRSGGAPLDRPGDLLMLAHEVDDEFVPEAARRIDLLRMLDAAGLPGMPSGGGGSDAGVVAAEPSAPPPSPPAATVVVGGGGISLDVGGLADGLATSTAEAEAAAAASESDDRCIQCRSRTRNRVTLPCAHFLLCDRCLESLGRCPRCGKGIVATVTAFIT